MRFRTRICPFEELVAAVPDEARVLDVGCGSGLLLVLLAAMRRGIAGIGFDSSKVAIEVARSVDLASIASEGSRIEFLHRAIGEPWPEGQFDVVCLVDVMHHVPPADQQSLFEQCIGRVRPGGLLLYKDMSDTPLLHATWNRMHDLLLARQWIHYRSIADVDRWAVAAGCRTVASARIRRALYEHDLRVFRVIDG